MSFWYLATPYSKYPGGIEEAFRLAARYAGRLITAGVKVYSPITHTHPIAVEAGLDPYNHDIWMPADQPFMDAARGLIVLKAASWEQSRGIREEIGHFTVASKPIVFTEPYGPLPAELFA